MILILVLYKLINDKEFEAINHTENTIKFFSQFHNLSNKKKIRNLF